jgi:hypothetical protein
VKTKGTKFTLSVWDLTSDTNILLEGHSNLIWGADELSDGRIISWSNDETIRIWQLNKDITTLVINTQKRVHKAIELPNQMILSRYLGNKTVDIWDFNGNHITQSDWHPDQPNEVVSVMDSKLLSWTSEGIMYLWDWKVDRYDEIKGHTESIVGILLLNNYTILSWGRDNILRLWNLKGQSIKHIDEHTNRIDAVKQLRNGNIISWTGGNIVSRFESKNLRDFAPRIWKSSGQLINVLKASERGPEGVLELTNGKLLIWTSDKLLYLWDLSRNSYRKMDGHKSSVLGCKQLSNGMIVSWGIDIILWDDNGSLITALKGHSRIVYDCIELTDARLISWGRDNTIRLWKSASFPHHIIPCREHPDIPLHHGRVGFAVA